MQSLYISSAKALKFFRFTYCFLSALLILKIKQIIFLKKNGRNFGTQPIAFGGLFKIKKIDNKVKLWYCRCISVYFKITLITFWSKIFERWTCLWNETVKDVAKSGAERRKRIECGFYGLVTQLQDRCLCPQGHRQNSLPPRIVIRGVTMQPNN